MKQPAMKEASVYASIRQAKAKAGMAGGGWWNREDLPEQRILNVGTGEADILADQPNAVGSIGAALSGLLHPDTLP
jgi:hypothetical protein